MGHHVDGYRPRESFVMVGKFEGTRVITVGYVRDSDYFAALRLGEVLVEPERRHLGRLICDAGLGRACKRATVRLPVRGY